MARNKKIIIGIIVAVIVVLGWAPWLNNQKLHDKVLEERGRLDGTIDKNGNLVCDYNVVWLPFGRWVGSCKGAYYVTFWGEILPPKPTSTPTQGEQVVKEIIPKEVVKTYLEKNIIKPTFGGKMFCNYEPLGEESNSNIHFYVWALCEEYYLKGGKALEGSGASLAVALTLQKENDSYKVIEHKVPEEFYPESIERIFPKSVRQKMFSNDINYHSQHINILENEIKKEAEFYFFNKLP